MLNSDSISQVDIAHAGKKIVFERIRLVLFDLDGTLVDSVGDLAWCGNEMLLSLGMPPRDPKMAEIWVGNGIERFVKRVLSGEMEVEPDPQLFAAGMAVFSELYAKHASDRCKLYPGALEALAGLDSLDLQLGCVTNKPEPFTSSLIAAMGIESFFSLIVAGDTTARKKPDPMPLHFAADHFGLDYDACLMVGDSSIDVLAARAAGFGIICVPYGYNHGKNISDSEPDLVVENLIELIGMFT